MNIIFNLLNTSLNYFFNITHDWGIAIVLLTVLVRLILMPMSIKQKLNIESQQKLSNKIESLKQKYKNDKKKLDIEIQKHYAESAKSMMGCFVTLLQLPIIYTLYNVILKMPVHAGTIIIPWIANIKLPDSYFILPLIYTVTMLAPSLLSYIPIFKVSSQNIITKPIIIATTFMSLLISIKIPIAVGIYLITTNIFSLFEEISFRLYLKTKLSSDC